MRLAVGVIVLALVAGCGSSPVAYEEAPGEPVELTVPGDASALAPASATATPTPDAARRRSSAETQAPETQAPETQQETAPEGTEGGGTEAPAGEGEGDEHDAGLRGQRGVLRGQSRRLLSSALKFPHDLPIHRSTPVSGRQDHCELHRTPGLTRTRPLNRLAHEAATAASPEGIHAALEAALRALLAADQVRMLRVTQDRSGAAEALLADEDERSDGYLRFGDGPSGTASVIASGRPLAVPDARTSTAIVPGRAEHHGIASSLFVPVAWGGECATS